MINWENLYTLLLETKQSLEGEQHHVLPKHAGGRDEDGIVRLSRRYHILAHYLRYRWLGAQGDRVAFKMMSGQLKNPMHDALIKAKHKKIMQTPEQREKYKKPKSAETKEALSQARKKYVSALESTLVMTHHMQTPEIIEKRRLSIIEGNKQNPERVLERAARVGQARKEKNKLLSAEELKAQYGSPTVTNGKWRGYVVIEKHGTREIYETIKQAAQVLNLAYSTMLNAIKKGTGTEKSILYGTTIYLSKDIK
tara:strand:+ start:46 stop:804 length:759 start_codon:yes stop_codon:yes gene_type:complete